MDRRNTLPAAFRLRTSFLHRPQQYAIRSSSKHPKQAQEHPPATITCRPRSRQRHGRPAHRARRAVLLNWKDPCAPIGIGVHLAVTIVQRFRSTSGVAKRPRRASTAFLPTSYAKAFLPTSTVVWIRTHRRLRRRGDSRTLCCVAFSAQNRQGWSKSASAS